MSSIFEATSSGVLFDSVATIPLGCRLDPPGQPGIWISEDLPIPSNTTDAVATAIRRVRNALNLEPGQAIQLVVIDANTVTLRVQAIVDRDQAWILSPEWESRIRAGVEDIGEGRTVVHESDEAFLASLEG